MIETAVNWRTPPTRGGTRAHFQATVAMQECYMGWCGGGSVNTSSDISKEIRTDY